MDTARVDALLADEQERFLARTRASLAELRRTAVHLPLGVASAYQAQPPYPLVIERGAGCRVWDLDGHEYLDLHAGFGANVFGHAHPQIVQALSQQAAEGAHFAHPTLSLGRYVRALAERYGLAQLRLANSGSEATMEALRLARAYTGRSKILRFEGAYHGHHDLVLASMKPDPAVVGDAARPGVQPSTAGLSPGVLDEVIPLHFNDAATAEAVLADGEVAAVIVEPIMCNLGLLKPRLDFLPRLRRACDRSGTVLIWDQVKTGGTVAWGGAGELFPDCLPDLHCLGKTVGGGLPVGVWGGRRELMRLIADGQVDGYGTFNGNPMTVAGGLAALTVMDRDAHRQLEDLNRQLHRWTSRLVRDYQLPAYASWCGVKSGIFWAPRMPRNYREYLQLVDRRLAQLAWLWLANRGVLAAPGADEQWTLCLPLADLQELAPLTRALTGLAEALTSR